MKHIPLVIVCMLVLVCATWAQNSQDNQIKDGATITIPKSDYDALMRRLDQLEKDVAELKGTQALGNTVASEPTPAPGGGGKQLSLPDISLVVQATGKLTDDNLDPNRQKLQLSEAEIGIQGYVYPNVKADAFITMSPAEGASAQVEEAYLSYLGVKKGMNFYVGQKHVPFGRTNLLHNHSWLYIRQPLAISNLVDSESLTGQGAAVSYLIPTHSSLFAQLDLGTWANGDSAEESSLPGEGNLGANFSDRFNTARLWTGHPMGENGELELGGSWAGGKSSDDPLSDHVTLTGVDLTYRHFGEADKRLLLRGESFWRHGSLDSDGNTATGYYLFGNYRPTKYGSIGLLYDWSEFPQASNLHESAMSLILTKQFSEQYYLRLQGIHGSRPDANSFNELWLQWVWGVGPHTHNLE
jgi:hypothetical protein